MSFDDAFKQIILTEGSTYTNDVIDRGGPTKFGITIADYSSYLKRKASADEVKAMTEDVAKLIYRQFYWDELRLDEVKDQVKARILFDQAVNRGTATAVRQAQEALVRLKYDIAVDGNVGQKTIDALNDADLFKWGISFVKASQLSYAVICVKMPSQVRFLKGWINRTHELLDLVIKEG